MREDLSSLGRGESRERTSVESRVLESETTIHTVGRQLESYLFDFPL